LYVVTVVMVVSRNCYLRSHATALHPTTAHCMLWLLWSSCHVTVTKTVLPTNSHHLIATQLNLQWRMKSVSV